MLKHRLNWLWSKYISLYDENFNFLLSVYLNNKKFLQIKTLPK